MTKVKIIVAGPFGKMGSEVVKMVEATEHFKLVAVVDIKHDGKNLSEIEGFANVDAKIYTDIKACFEENAADVLIDFTAPSIGMYHAETAISYGIRPVVGTTGFTQENLKKLEEDCKAKGIGCIIAPNFAMGAVLMMKFAEMAAKHFQDVEIMELHHDQKLDAPSGTAMKTAEMISAVRTSKKQGHPEEVELLEGVRGATYDGMHIHSIRLPGLIAHQEVLFGSNGQTLSIRHDSYHRESFMSGVKFAVDTVMEKDTFIYGLENIIE